MGSDGRVKVVDHGFELTTRLRQLRAYRTTPILLATSLSDFGPSFRPSTEGVTDVIIKPFLLVELGLKCRIHLIGVNERWVRLSASRKPEPTDPG